MTLNLTKIQKDELAHEHWVILTNDSITQQVITDALAARGESTGSTAKIFYGGKIRDVYWVDFEKDVLYLVLNRHKVPYSFVALHRKNRSQSWHKWNEGKKTPVQKLKVELSLSAQELKAAALKKKKRDRLIIKKSALAAM